MVGAGQEPQLFGTQATWGFLGLGTNWEVFGDCGVGQRMGPAEGRGLPPQADMLGLALRPHAPSLRLLLSQPGLESGTACFRWSMGLSGVQGWDPGKAREAQRALILRRPSQGSLALEGDAFALRCLAGHT